MVFIIHFDPIFFTIVYNFICCQKSIIVCDQRVEISCIEYFDKIFVIVTGSGRLGAIVIHLFKLL